MTEHERMERPSSVAATVTEILPNAMYRVEMDGGDELQVHLAGAMRVQATRVLVGDRVQVEVSPFDRGKGRIVGNAPRRTP